MVSSLHFFRTFKSFKKWVKKLGYSESVARKYWKGPGYYYHRGKGYFCKYSEKRDKKRGGRVSKGKWRHTTDISTKLLEGLTKKDRERIIKRINSLVRRYMSKGYSREKALLKAERKIAYELGKLKIPKKKFSPIVRHYANFLWNSIPKKYRQGRNRRWTYGMVLFLTQAVYEACKKKKIRAIDEVFEEIADSDWRMGYREKLREIEDRFGLRVRQYAPAEKEIKEYEEYMIAQELIRQEYGMPEEPPPELIW